MSFLFGNNARPQPSSAEKIAAAEAEAELMMDMYNRLAQSCTKKCIPPDYREPDLNKGEGVCVDRCVSKFFEVNVKVGEKMQGDMQARTGGGGLGFGG